MSVALVVRFALGFANVPSDISAEAEAALPALARLAKVAKQVKPDIDQVINVLDKLAPYLEK